MFGTRAFDVVNLREKHKCFGVSYLSELRDLINKC